MRLRFFEIEPPVIQNRNPEGYVHATSREDQSGVVNISQHYDRRCGSCDLGAKHTYDRHNQEVALYMKDIDLQSSVFLATRGE